MTGLQKVALRQSEIRTRLHELGDVEDVTDEIKTEISALTDEMKGLEHRSQALIAAGETLDPPEAEQTDEKLQELIDQASAGEIMTATLEHRSTAGPTAELQQELELQSNQVPLAMLEHRAVTPAPANVGQQQQPIIPAVFPASVAAFLDVDMPTVGVGEAVYPVLTTSATVHSPAENDPAADTEGAFSADVLSPGRLQASFFYSREDRARFAGMDEALRMNLGEALADELDKKVIAGGEGLLTGTNLANNASSAEATFATYLSGLAYDRVDGIYATTTDALRSVVGSPTFAHMGSTYRADESDMNTLDRIQAITGGLRVSAHVPAVASKKQNAIVRRGMRRDMVAPIWEGVTLIPDEVTKAATGQIKVTAVMLYAVKILRAAGFTKQEFQVAA